MPDAAQPSGLDWLMQRMTGMLPTPTPLPPTVFPMIQRAPVSNPSPVVLPSNVATVRG